MINPFRGTDLDRSNTLATCAGDMLLLFFSARSLTPSMLAWAASTGRFKFHKDTSLSIEVMLEKLRAVQAVKDCSMK